MNYFALIERKWSGIFGLEVSQDALTPCRWLTIISHLRLNVSKIASYTERDASFAGGRHGSTGGLRVDPKLAAQN